MNNKLLVFTIVVCSCLGLLSSTATTYVLHEGHNTVTHNHDRHGSMTRSTRGDMRIDGDEDDSDDYEEVHKEEKRRQHPHDNTVTHNHDRHGSMTRSTHDGMRMDGDDDETDVDDSQLPLPTKTWMDSMERLRNGDVDAQGHGHGGYWVNDMAIPITSVLTTASTSDEFPIVFHLEIVDSWKFQINSDGSSSEFEKIVSGESSSQEQRDFQAAELTFFKKLNSFHYGKTHLEFSTTDDQQRRYNAVEYPPNYSHYPVLLYADETTYRDAKMQQLYFGRPYPITLVKYDFSKDEEHDGNAPLTVVLTAYDTIVYQLNRTNGRVTSFTKIGEIGYSPVSDKGQKKKERWMIAQKKIEHIIENNPTIVFAGDDMSLTTETERITFRRELE